MAPVFVRSVGQLEVETFEWGTIQWLCNARLSPGAAQTLGVCTLLPGRSNPLHYHPNCEELLHVMSGAGEHRIGDESIRMETGMIVRIPTGVRHSLHNSGAQPLLCLIAFSSGERQTIFLE